MSWERAIRLLGRTRGRSGDAVTATARSLQEVERPFSALYALPPLSGLALLGC